MRRENEERELREQARQREEEMRRMDEQVARERKAKEERERQAATAELRKLQGRAFDEKEAAGLSLMELNVRVLSARDVAKKEREERVAKDSERQLFLARALREAALPGLKELFATQHATEVAYWEQAFETQYEQKKKQNEKLAVLKPVCERLQAHLEGYATGVVTRRAEAVREVVEKRFEEAEAKRKAEEEKKRAEEEKKKAKEEKQAAEPTEEPDPNQLLVRRVANGVNMTFGVLDDVAAHTLTISLTREGTYKQFSKLQTGEEPLSFSYRGASYAFSAKPSASVKDVRKRAIAVALRSSAQL